MKAIITQSNYIPWIGFFDSLNAVDLFVVYDDMQYTKRDWRNRNLIKTPSGLKWLTIPVEVKGKFYQKIKDTKIADKEWNISHLQIIKQNYKTAAYYKEMIDWIEPLYLNCKFEFLTDVNVYFIEAICDFIEINIAIKYSTGFDLEAEKTERLVNICKELGVTDYYSGPAAKNYMDINKFSNENINVQFWDYSGYNQYNQLFGNFEQHVTILDLIFNEGNKAIKYFKF